MGFDNLQNMADTLGVNVTDLTNTLLKNFWSANDRITDQRKDLVQNMNKYTKEGKAKKTYEGDYNAKLLKNLENYYGEVFRDSLEGTFVALQRSGDDSIISAGYDNFISLAD
jgi:hypothetical protein